MAMIRVCDLCGNPVSAPHKQMKVLDYTTPDMPIKDAKTIKSMDLHNKCYAGLLEHIERTLQSAKEIQDVSA